MHDPAPDPMPDPGPGSAPRSGTEASPLAALFRALADVYAAEGRAGGDAAAAAYREAAGRLDAAPPARPHPPLHLLVTECRAALAAASHPAARAALAAEALLPWRSSDVPGSALNASARALFAVAPLIGPGALVEIAGLRAGLFLQRPEALYPLHAHAAEETYAVLHGAADWTLDAVTTRHDAGALIHHPAHGAHATRTGPAPMLAAWRWSGDIRLETYRMVGPAR
ncbi:hypothetical protein LNKW23_12350 [Paralimibaculum aggregatum]|uniref:Cupin domain-containing protein n=1 Tax=Paralimibaculum aggregatum TaxID=3036245 RepID=A0ABQ6LFA7_9RHOB|nr:dimethylsulfonioproprionate lyase family protein [Limibaculum sp. NKW23]GMG82022.1 hypothetical protein LNKW23_12350 [Limibaculum sp. NKW23]